MTTRKIVLHNDHDDQSNGTEPATTLTFDETKKSMVIDGDVEITGKLTSSNQVVGNSGNNTADSQVKENLLIGDFTDAGEKVALMLEQECWYYFRYRSSNWK